MPRESLLQRVMVREFVATCDGVWNESRHASFSCLTCEKELAFTYWACNQ